MSGEGSAPLGERARALGVALTRLYALAPRGARYGLAPIAKAAALEGHPENALPTVHIAGTNGKGSVAASIEAIARAAGLSVGLYTSPHLVKFAERFRIDGDAIDDQRLEARLAEVLDRHPSLTFFEVATLVAWKAFVEAHVDLAVMEVGLGGRLDATNLVERPLATAIVSIGIDHAELLGDTLAAIATEKAGIVKPGVPLVLGRMPSDALDVILAIAAERGAGPVWCVGRELLASRAADGSLRVAGPGGRAISVRPTLAGPHQDANTAVAVGLAWMLQERPSLGPRLASDEAITTGVANVRWPGRLEAIDAREPGLAGDFLLDGAHNEDGARALALAMDVRSEPASERALVFGVMGDKPWSSMLSVLKSRFSRFVIVAPRADGGGRRAADPQAIAATLPNAEVAVDPYDALVRARRAVGERGLVVVAGSLYLVGEVRASLLGLARDPHVGL